MLRWSTVRSCWHERIGTGPNPGPVSSALAFIILCGLGLTRGMTSVRAKGAGRGIPPLKMKIPP